MRESYALTMYVYLMSVDADRMEHVVAYGHRIDLAGMIAYAFHEPKKLKALDVKFQSLIGGASAKDAAIERAKRMHEELMKTPGFHA